MPTTPTPKRSRHERRRGDRRWLETLMPGMSAKPSHDRRRGERRMGNRRKKQ
jgi:hypothetical protein